MKQFSYYDDRSLSARAYDDVEGAFDAAGHSATRGDIAFYKELAARTGGLVLDVGTGTGRIAWALAEAGHAVLGIDTSAVMLAQAEAKRARHSPETGARAAFVLRDVVDLDVKAAFALIVVTFRTFNHIREPAAQQRALASVARHLAPGGLAALHMIGEPASATREGAPGAETVLRYADSGLTLRYRTRERTVDTARQTVTATIQYRVSAPDGAVVEESLEVLAMRWCTEAEVRRWCAELGLTVEALFGDFACGESGPGKEQVWLLRKAR